MGVAGIDRGLTAILGRSARGARRTAEAVRFGDDVLTFGGLAESATRVAQGLRANGVRRGDRVAVLLRNGLEWVQVFLGIAECGAVCVPANVLLGPSEIAQLLADADATALVVDSAGAAAAADSGAVPDLVIGVGGARVPAARWVAFDDLLTARPDPLADPGRPDDLLVFYYTSGTTGLPKGSMHTHGTVMWNSYHQVADLGVGPDEVYLVVPSLSWAAGFHDVMLAAMWMGGRSVLMPTGGVTPERIVAEIERCGATRALLVPTLLKQLLGDEPLLERLRRSTMTSVLTGAEPVPLAVISELNAALPGCRFRQGYGLSEFPTVASILQPDEAVSHAGTAGRATSITRMAVMTESGSIADSGTGEVLLRSPATMLGYWNRPDETAAAFADGWLHTGDVGSIDDDGLLTVTGRKKDMIISGGLNIYPSEVEAVIYGFPGIREASVVGVPDGKWGEVPVAIVVPEESFDAEGLAAHCAERLARYKRPHEVLLKPDGLPRSPTGKVLKRELQPWAAERRSLSP